MEISDKIFNAGVVGAGGAGFPTHVKSKSKVDYVIANGAECEPLLHKDFEITRNFPERVVHGMELMANATGAKRGYIGIKDKNFLAIEEVEKYLEGKNLEVVHLQDYYPAGDEYELVYNATGRLIPPHGIPLDVGCVVNNVESLYNVSLADEGVPVTEKFICVTGAVKNPSTFFVPIGTTFEEAIKFAGGTTVSDFGIFVGGLMMGSLTDNISEVVTKTIGALIILPKEHHLVTRMDRPVADMNRIGKSACDQCSYCTEFCPRYLMGYDVQPHKVMRSLEFTKTGYAVWNEYADLCSSCGLCTLYSCPEELYPREACNQGQTYLREQNRKHEQKKEVKIHPIKDGRKVPVNQLMKKLNVTKYNVPTPFVKGFPEPDSVKILLKQHVGAPAVPVVDIGNEVKKGDLIGKIDDGKLGAPVHASISGKVSHVSDEFIRITKV
jgi:Na+-translocating ferredoxin:NAD+ oxidoreductase RnfC subunit